jgi:hypothetical protein
MPKEIPFQFFKSLAASPTSLAEDEQTLVSALEPKAKVVLKKFDFDRVLERFNSWFLDLLRKEPPSKKIIGLWFGLYQTEDGATLYVSGSNTFDANDPDWPCSNDWWPKGRYAPLEQLDTLWSELKQCDVEEWEVILGIAICLVKNFFACYSGEFQKVSSLSCIHVATGFDSGDIYDIPTSITPNT